MFIFKYLFLFVSYKKASNKQLSPEKSLLPTYLTSLTKYNKTLRQDLPVKLVVIVLNMKIQELLMFHEAKRNNSFQYLNDL